MIEIRLLVAIFLGIAIISLWVVLFLGFLFGYRNKIEVNKYFRFMFDSYRKSNVRVIWKSIILGFEYVIGLLFSVLVFSAWYLAKTIRFTLQKIIFSK